VVDDTRQAGQKFDGGIRVRAGQESKGSVSLGGNGGIREDIEKQLKASAIAATSRRNFLVPKTNGSVEVLLNILFNIKLMFYLRSTSSCRSSDETTDVTAGSSDSDVEHGDVEVDDYMNTFVCSLIVLETLAENRLIPCL